ALCLECDEGTLVTQWLDDRRSHVVVVLVEAGANTGMARYKVGAEAPALARWVRHRKSEAPPGGGAHVVTSAAGRFE
ncbi:MAG: hypothetical protein ACOC1F_02355, partial [Myxococcota bacterium]